MPGGGGIGLPVETSGGAGRRRDRLAACATGAARWVRPRSERRARRRGRRRLRGGGRGGGGLRDGGAAGRRRRRRGRGAPVRRTRSGALADGRRRLSGRGSERLVRAGLEWPASHGAVLGRGDLDGGCRGRDDPGSLDDRSGRLGRGSGHDGRGRERARLRARRQRAPRCRARRPRRQRARRPWWPPPSSSTSPPPWPAFSGSSGWLLADQPFAFGLAADAVGLRLDDARGVALHPDPQRFAEVERLLVRQPELSGQLVDADLRWQGCGQPFGWEVWISSRPRQPMRLSTRQVILACPGGSRAASLDQRAQSSVCLWAERVPQCPAQAVVGRLGRCRSGRPRRARPPSRAGCARWRRDRHRPHRPSPAPRGCGADGSRRRCGSGQASAFVGRHLGCRLVDGRFGDHLALAHVGRLGLDDGGQRLLGRGAFLPLICRDGLAAFGGCQTCSPVSGSTIHSPSAHSSLW